MRKQALVWLLAAALGLGLSGCVWLRRPAPEPDPLASSVEVEVVETVAQVVVTITGGEAPYWVRVWCDEQVACGELPCLSSPTEVPAVGSPPCPRCPCTVTVDCTYEGPGTYTVVVSVVDRAGEEVWCGVDVTIEDPALTTYVITSSAGVGGSITPLGRKEVQAGADVVYTVRAFGGHVLGDVLVDGESVLGDLVVQEPGVWTYTFVDVRADHTIIALFGTGTPPEPAGP